MDRRPRFVGTGGLAWLTGEERCEKPNRETAKTAETAWFGTPGTIYWGFAGLLD